VSQRIKCPVNHLRPLTTQPRSGEVSFLRIAFASMSAPVDHRKLPRNKLTAGRFIGIDDDIMSRLIERDAREHADSRSMAERWLGDPPPERSVLAQRDRR
jgi:hypothetical protein